MGRCHHRYCGREVSTSNVWFYLARVLYCADAARNDRWLYHVLSEGVQQRESHSCQPWTLPSTVYYCWRSQASMNLAFVESEENCCDPTSGDSKEGYWQPVSSIGLRRCLCLERRVLCDHTSILLIEVRCRSPRLSLSWVVYWERLRLYWRCILTGDAIMRFFFNLRADRIQKAWRVCGAS